MPCRDVLFVQIGNWACNDEAMRCTLWQKSCFGPKYCWQLLVNILLRIHLTFHLNSAVCLHICYDFQLFIYVFNSNCSCLFIVYVATSAVCLHFIAAVFQVFTSKFSCLFTYLLWFSAVYLRIQFKLQLFIYSLSSNFSCLFTFH